MRPRIEVGLIRARDEIGVLRLRIEEGFVRARVEEDFMRVIAGSARGRRLKAVRGDTTRPITDRAKEALFSILGEWISDARVLDLFAGTGAVGIEALSRGAAWCDFVDLAPTAVETVRENLEHTGLSAHAAVKRRDAFKLLGTPPAEAYDLIYIAPPQYRGWWLDALRGVDRTAGWIAPDGLAIVQIGPREDVPVELERLREIDRRKYGGVRLIFYALIDDRADAEEV